MKPHDIIRLMLKVLIFLTTSSLASIYNFQSCSSSQLLNTKSLACEACPQNMQPNKIQSYPNECVCKNYHFFSITDVKCVPYTSSNANSTSQYLNAFGGDGSRIAISSYLNCDSKAFQNSNGTGCTPCMTGMSFSAINKKCQCIDNTYIETQMGCFPESYTSVLGMTLTSSLYYNKLKYLIPGCYYFKNPLSCSQIINLCIYSLMVATPQCEFFKKANLTSYLHSQSVNVFKQSALTKSTQIKMKIVFYLPEGNYVQQKSFKLSDIVKCGLSTNADTVLWIGSNIQVICDFNFNNLLSQIAGKSYQSYLYQLFIHGDNNKYYEVNVYLNNNQQPVKRFFLQDSFTSKSYLNLLTSMKLEFTLSTDGILINPSLYLSYSKLSLETGTGITPSSQQVQSLSYTIQFTSQLSGFWSVVLPIFIVINILAIIHASAKTYISYLNRRTPFLFFLHFIDAWSFWMFYFLLVITGYWFLFTKTTSNIYTFISNSPTLYVSFYVVFGIMVAFRLISVISDKIDKLKIQIFLINKEKDKTINNSARQIFITNSLANFSTYRTFSVFWILTVTLFFSSGLKWQQHAREVVNTSLDQIQYFYKKNPILLYFLSSSVILVVSIVFKILRRITVLFWPYPFEDFVDYCSVSNISLFFMKKRSPEAYYINACLSQNTEVTFKELNHTVRRGLEKTRSLSINLNQPNRLKLYITYVNRDLQEKFNQMIKKQEDQDHNRHMKYSIGSSVSLKPVSTSSKSQFYFRQQFIEKRVKPALEQIIQKDQGRTKSVLQSVFQIPPEDLRNERGLNETRVYIDDNLDIVREVFPNGDEFEQIHTIIIIYLLFIVLTGNSLISAFLTYLVDEWIFNSWISSAYRKHLQKMTRVKEGFML